MRKSCLSLLFLLLLVCTAAISQPFTLDSLGVDGVVLDSHWKFHEGDDSSWAAAGYNDAGWDTIPIDSYPPNRDTVLWYRLHLRFNASLLNIPLALSIRQTGAADIYLDGKKLISYGIVSAGKNQEEGYNPKNEPFILTVGNGQDHVLAIRYSNHVTRRKSQPFGPELTIGHANTILSEVFDLAFAKLILGDITLGFFMGLTFLHLLLYFFYRSDTSNLYYSLFTGAFLFLLFSFHFHTYHTSSESWNVINKMLPVAYPCFFFLLFLLGTRLFGMRRKKFFYLTVGITAATILFYFFNSRLYSYLLISLIFNVSITMLFTIWYAFKKRTDGSVILGTGMVLSLLFIIIMLILLIFNDFSISLTGGRQVLFLFFLMLSVLSIPISMSVYLARNFAFKSKTLTLKLDEVQELSEKNLQHAREKEELLSQQNEKLEGLVKLRTAEVTTQKNILEEQKEQLEIKNREILDSLQYARFLQEVILPPVSFINEKVTDSFILFKPKDIVAGDFYFSEMEGDHFFIAVADCTGHGVPGAMLSILCSNALSQAVKEFRITDPGKVLDKVNEIVGGTFDKSRQAVNDGMDISLLVINRKEKEITWAGAYNHIWYTENDSLQVIKGNKQPIGKHLMRSPFITHHIPWQEGSRFYLFTDGYADQFGGKDGKKFMRRNLYELIKSAAMQPAAEQKKLLEETFRTWSMSHEQVDDVTIVGVII